MWTLACSPVSHSLNQILSALSLWVVFSQHRSVRLITVEQYSSVEALFSLWCWRIPRLCLAVMTVKSYCKVSWKHELISLGLKTSERDFWARGQVEAYVHISKKPTDVSPKLLNHFMFLLTVCYIFSSLRTQTQRAWYTSRIYTGGCVPVAYCGFNMHLPWLLAQSATWWTSWLVSLWGVELVSLLSF